MSTEATVPKLPACQFTCTDTASYDFKTTMGPWAYGCERHWLEYRFFDTLGTGKGQRLILAKETA